MLPALQASGPTGVFFFLEGLKGGTWVKRGWGEIFPLTLEQATATDAAALERATASLERVAVTLHWESTDATALEP